MLYPLNSDGYYNMLDRPLINFTVVSVFFLKVSCYSFEEKNYFFLKISVFIMSIYGILGLGMKKN